MKPAELARTLLAFVVLIVLHYTVRPLLGWRAAPDFLVIALLVVSIRVRPGTAAVVGLCVGLISDALDLQAFGAGALAMSVVGFAASWLKAVFFADDIILNALFLFAGKWAFDIIYLLTEHQYGFGELLLQLLVWSPLSALVTAAFGMLALLLLRPILKPQPA